LFQSWARIVDIDNAMTAERSEDASEFENDKDVVYMRIKLYLLFTEFPV